MDIIIEAGVEGLVIVVGRRRFDGTCVVETSRFWSDKIDLMINGLMIVGRDVVASTYLAAMIFGCLQSVQCINIITRRKKLYSS